jgi:hypothetical protein
VTSSHSGSPSKGMWTAQRTHIPCRGFPVQPRRRMRSLTRAAGVEARVVPVGLRPDRTMEVPAVDQRSWNRTRRPVLRLITCGGSFDRSSGNYRDNVIVYTQADN